MNQTDYRRQLLTAPGGVADRLRALRENAELSGVELVERISAVSGGEVAASSPKISKIESGTQMPSTADIKAWCAACEHPEAVAELVRMADDVRSQHRAWKTRLDADGGEAQVQADFKDLDTRARRIRNFENVLYPGLLQTPELAKAVLTQALGHLERPEQDVADGVAGRLARQQVIYDESKTLEFLIDEPVLRRPIFGVGVAIRQLYHLRTLAGLRHVRIGALPMDRPLRAVPMNGFIVFDNVVFVETPVGETRHEGEDAEVYQQYLDELWGDAVEGEELLERIDQAETFLHMLEGSS